MRRALIVFSCVSFLCVVSYSADAQTPARMRFEGMDSNRDGVISREEWRGSARSFEVHDWNRDGRLSGPEVAIGGRRGTVVEEADHVPGRFERNLNWTAAGFTSLDHNRDRRITANEWHFDVETFRRADRNGDGALTQAEFIGSNDWDDDRGDSFDDLDMNNNGQVERSEWHGGSAVFTELDRNRDGVLSRFEVVGGVEDDRYDDFADLDYNRNGSIERGEWHASLGSFNQRDLNRDGMLSRREFETTTGGATPVGTSGTIASRRVIVSSQQRWTDAGIDVRAGDTIAFQSSGSIRMSDNGEDLASPGGSNTGRKAPDAPILSQPAGALIARIGNYGPIFIGDRGSIVAPASGRLYFGVNDDHLPDNSGEYTVNVSVQR